MSRAGRRRKEGDDDEKAGCAGYAVTVECDSLWTRNLHARVRPLCFVRAKTSERKIKKEGRYRPSFLPSFFLPFVSPFAFILTFDESTFTRFLPRFSYPVTL